VSPDAPLGPSTGFRTTSRLAPQTSRGGWGRWLPVAAACAVGLGLRLWGIDFGLPHLYHADEWRLVMPALSMLHTGDLNPHEFLYGSLLRYLLAAVYLVYATYGRWTGSLAGAHDIPVFGPEAIREVYAYPVPAIYVLGRAATAMLGALTIVVIYAAGRRSLGGPGAFVAGLALAVSPLHVVHSHFITADVPLAFFVALCFLFALQAAEDGGRGAYALVGVAAGLAAATKHSGVLAGAFLVAAHMFRPPGNRRGSYLLIGVAAAGASYLIATPFAALDFSTWWAGVRQAGTLYDLPGRSVEGSSARWYLHLLFEPPQASITIAASLGLAAALWRRQRVAWLSLAFLAPYLLLFSLKTARAPRTLVPVVPFLALLAAHGALVAAAWLQRIGRPLARSRAAIATLLVTLVLAWPTYAAVGHARDFARPEVRTLTRRWIEGHLPPQARIALDGVAPTLPPGRYRAQRIWSLMSHDVDWYRRQGFDYIVLNEVSRAYPSRTVEEEARNTAFLSHARLHLVGEVEGPLLSYPGFRAWIFSVDH
jgi:4-amino-4-deoxy-L-arabinose transferase-like glycosyltransferase